MSKSAQFRIKVTSVRGPRKPKVQPKQYTTQLLDLLDNPDLLSRLQTPDLFVSVVASAVKDLSR